MSSCTKAEPTELRVQNDSNGHALFFLINWSVQGLNVKVAVYYILSVLLKNSYTNYAKHLYVWKDTKNAYL